MLKTTAPARRPFWVPARPHPRERHAVGDGRACAIDVVSQALTDAQDASASVFNWIFFGEAFAKIVAMNPMQCHNYIGP